MKALEEELGTALVSQLNAEDQQEVWPVLISLISPKFKNTSNFKLSSVWETQKGTLMYVTVVLTIGRGVFQLFNLHSVIKLNEIIVSQYIL